MKWITGRYQRQTEEAISLSREHGTEAYLIDLRQLNNRTRFSDVFRINQLYREPGQALDTK